MTSYNITFGDSVDWRLLCQMSLNKTTMDQFRMAIHNNYFFEMVIDDDLPMWGYIGDVVESRFLVHNVDGKNRCFLFPHIQFILGYNQDRIVSARMITGVSK
jgi:transmembrane 9 superfamily member 3